MGAVIVKSGSVRTVMGVEVSAMACVLRLCADVRCIAFVVTQHCTVWGWWWVFIGCCCEEACIPSCVSRLLTTVRVMPVVRPVLSRCTTRYLPSPSVVEENINKDAVRDLPMLFCHGDADPMVLPKWSALSVEKVREWGATNVERKTYPGMEHAACIEELEDVIEFVKKVMP